MPSGVEEQRAAYPTWRHSRETVEAFEDGAEWTNVNLMGGGGGGAWKYLSYLNLNVLDFH